MIDGRDAPNRRRVRGWLAPAAALFLACALAAAPAAQATGPGDAPPAAAPSVDELRDPASTAVLVNASRPLDPVDHVPNHLEPVTGSGHELVPEAAAATRELIEAAASAGHFLAVESGYRSYTRQAELFDQYSARYGEAYASRISAEPGTSEHQLGLAVDLGLTSGLCSLQACFGDTEAGQWIAEHAGEYGFIIRYPEGSEELTGYSYEPWHLRYLGEATTADFAASKAGTYEEYVDALEAAADVVAEPLDDLPPEGSALGPLRIDVSDGLFRLSDWREFE
ncbi:M15 family metallopeptidase [Zhihengliuella halotolerans]|uniref:D-alanyl-D-alanine carboxypeptidase n=1 Tax=Zhihengliuella halotolerans TaxID=370736 RepID=A0A4Q8AF18_9MICC|nr:M15 family metallopeptidase [Zhihengliuella halotolerans]RZU62441.1 D-alanyl-D-alanine carboxypeptidase [Zhihengliuella halotolerans]